MTTTAVSEEGLTTLPRLFAEWAAAYADEPALSRKIDGVFTPISFRELDVACAGARPGLHRGPRPA